jgi:predicted amidohydrolase
VLPLFYVSREQDELEGNYQTACNIELGNAVTAEARAARTDSDVSIGKRVRHLASKHETNSIIQVNLGAETQDYGKLPLCESLTAPPAVEKVFELYSFENNGLGGGQSQVITL